MEGKLATVIAEILKIPVEKIAYNLSMETVEAWDSLKHMDLIATIEKTFAFELTFDEIITMRSVEGIRNVLRARNIKE